MAAPRPLVKFKIFKKRPRSSSDTSQINMSKLSGTGRNPETRTTGCMGDSRATSWCLILVTGATRNQGTCCPGDSGSSWTQHRRVWSAADVKQILTMLRLLTSPPRTEKTEKPLWKEQSSWLLESAIPTSGYAANKMKRQLMYTLCLC